MRTTNRVRNLCLAVGVLAALSAGAQYPAQTYPAYPTANGVAARPPTMRQMFASSLTAAAATGGAGAINAVAQGLTGAITGWLDRKQQRAAMHAAAAGAYPSGATPTYAPPAGSYPPADGAYPGAAATGGAQYPAASGAYPASSGAYPAAGSQGSYPADAYPSGSTPAPSGYPPDASYPPGAGDPASSGYPAPGAQAGTDPAAYPPAYPSAGGAYPGADPGAVYAGVAYEIHLLDASGATQRVDPASHAFRTGDRFRVYYRPSLPGRIDVYNVNPLGQQAQIDTVNVGAGQLITLGPYEFTNQPGSETLILQLSPCSSAQLYAATRDIVKVQEGAGAGAGRLTLDACDSAATRGLKARRTKTRDIRKVAVEDGTSFALDPLSRAELQGGPVDPRQVTITLQHR